MPNTTSNRGRPRLESTDQRILQAARELLRLKGPAAVNIDSVAAHSGVARTTIYRRYRSRDELMHAVLEHLIDPAPLAPDLPVDEKLRWVMDRISDMLENRLGPGATAAIIANSDPEFTKAVRSRLAGRLSSLADLMNADVKAGLLQPTIDPDTVLGVLVGAYLAEVLRFGSPRKGWMDRAVAFLTPAITTP
ncbi:TetR/AcrR family transcriptional regulator C-terminal ligand-binding domain-containing protein [Kribbella jejuensis]|uniref:TetR family transcriptional regulator n=1 Tax=Kribbella jejuensis TaxID=236068 RepID=A0A542ELM1_9ACTN|nr:TetR/AcrR family transcriptional regulator [Kribbella jejuensis]TQJ16238.1 TetR family transcriptional regulator [Kribbella jejuensis]